MPCHRFHIELLTTHRTEISPQICRNFLLAEFQWRRTRESELQLTVPL